MATYLLMMFALMATALVPIWAPRYQAPTLVAVSALLALFAGLRFETGFDWPGYAQMFNGEYTAGIEPLYLLLNKAIAAIGGNLQLLFLLVAIFNVVVITYVASTISRSSVLLVWLVYFGFTFLPAQMAMERQSLASSFVLIGLLLSHQRRHIFALTSVVAGLGFHISVIVFAPILALRFFRPRGWIVAAVITAGCVVVVAKIDLFSPIAAFLLRNGWTWLSNRMSYYVESGASPISLAAMGYTAMQIMVLAGFYHLPSRDERRDPYVLTAIWLTIWILIALLFFGSMPSIWSRILLVSLPWQVATFCRLDAFSHLNRVRQTAIVAAASVASLGILVYYVGRPTTIVYRPYNSIVHVFVTGNRGDGKARSDQMIEMVNRQAAEKTK